MNALIAFFLLTLPGADKLFVRDLSDFSHLPTAHLNFADKRLKVLIANSAAASQLGLMGVREWPLSHALAFGPSARSFWMRNVPIPLDMVFLDQNLCVLSTTRLSPHSEVSYPVPMQTTWTFEMASYAIDYYGIQAGKCFQSSAA